MGTCLWPQGSTLDLYVAPQVFLPSRRIFRFLIQGKVRVSVETVLRRHVFLFRLQCAQSSYKCCCEFVAILRSQAEDIRGLFILRLYKFRIPTLEVAFHDAELRQTPFSFFSTIRGLRADPTLEKD